MLRCVIGLTIAAVLAAGCSDKSGNLTSSDPKERARAIESVASTASEKAVEQIVPLVRHEDAQTASAAVAALGRMSSPRACEVLQQVMVTEQRPEVRKVAATSLGERTEPQALETLRQALVADPAPEVRSTAAVSLARAGTIDEVPVLVAASGRETDQKVVRYQVLAMERLTGVRFPTPDPKMTAEQRREMTQRIRMTAQRLAEAKKNKVSQGACKHKPE